MLTAAQAAQKAMIEEERKFYELTAAQAAQK